MLTQLATVKARLGISDATDDTLITNFIKHVSGRFEAECKRSFGRTVGAVEEFAGDETEIRVSCYPIESVASFHLKTTEVDGWVAQTAPDYIIRRSTVISLYDQLGTWKQQARVTYTGGYVLPGTAVGAGQTALPDQVEQCCVEQSCYWYQNRNRLGLVSIGGEGSSVQQFAKLDLLPHVQSTLQSFSRLLC